MSFQYPWGLLLLLAIPVLIVIYILLNKYKEDTVSSSYVWELSKKFIKKKNPINTFSKLLALILQCCAIVFLAFSLAQPIFSFKNGADNIVFILDSSASMKMKSADDDTKTKFDVAKEKIKDVVANSTNGCTFSLILADSSTKAVCQNISDVDIFNSFIDNAVIDDNNSNLDNALSIAQSMVSENKGSLCYIATDETIDLGENPGDNLKVLDVSSKDNNYAIKDLEYSYDSRKKVMTLKTKVISYAEDTEIKVEFFVNDKSLGQKRLNVEKGKLSDISVDIADLAGNYKTYESIKASVLNEDKLPEDNDYYLYRSEGDITKILLVSSNPLYYEAAFSALNSNNCRIYYDVMKSSQYALYSSVTGYDIYVFDGYSPKQLPADGAVWLFNIDSVKGCGFVCQEEVKPVDPGALAKYTINSSDLIFQQLTKNLSMKNSIKVGQYKRYTLNNKFTVLLSCDNVPFVFAGKNDNNQRQIVCNFDLQNSDLPMLADYIILMRNFISYSNPKVLDVFKYEAGDTVTFSLPDSAKTIVVTTPSGKEEPISKSDLTTYKLEEAGTYSVKVTNYYGREKVVNFYSAYPSDESDPLKADGKQRSIVKNSQEQKANAIYDDILPFVIVAVVFFLTDWILYGHEQF